MATPVSGTRFSATVKGAEWCRMVPNGALPNGALDNSPQPFSICLSARYEPRLRLAKLVVASLAWMATSRPGAGRCRSRMARPAQPWRARRWRPQSRQGSRSSMTPCSHRWFTRFPPGRRHLIVALTDGQDCGSIATPDMVRDVAARSEAVLHWVWMTGLVRQRGPRSSLLEDLRRLPPELRAPLLA
jgi:hypothetical protein